MASRLALISLIVTLLVSLDGAPPQQGSPFPNLTTVTQDSVFELPKGLGINFTISNYDHENCGRPDPGRERRAFADDYSDTLEFKASSPPRNAEDGEMPWAVAILTKVPSSSSPRLCAGTLISRRHVLTAAHCLAALDEIPTNPGEIRCNTTAHFDLNDFMDWSEVKYGGRCLLGRDSTCDESMLAKSAKIQNITLFPFFGEDCSRGSDLVIIELDRNITDVSHACLPHLHDMEDETLRNESVTKFHTFRWTKSNGFNLADRLSTTDLDLKKDRCARKWPHLSPDVLCFSEAKHITQCMGESGSGLLTISHKRAFLLGVQSSSSACDPAHQPTEPVLSRYTDARLFSATIDLAIGTAGPFPDYSYLLKRKIDKNRGFKTSSTTTIKPIVEYESDSSKDIEPSAVRASETESACSHLSLSLAALFVLVRLQ